MFIQFVAFNIFLCFSETQANSGAQSYVLGPCFGSDNVINGAKQFGVWLAAEESKPVMRSKDVHGLSRLNHGHINFRQRLFRLSADPGHPLVSRVYNIRGVREQFLYCQRSHFRILSKPLLDKFRRNPILGRPWRHRHDTAAIGHFIAAKRIRSRCNRFISHFEVPLSGVAETTSFKSLMSSSK